jgi:signal transduction histidine kinase/CheY-like chemotaxis protein
MADLHSFSLLTIRLRHERHVVQARQRAREIAALLGFEHQEQIRLATATSELARNAFRYAEGGEVEFIVRDSPSQLFLITVTDTGDGIPNLPEILDGRYISKTGLGMGLIGTKRLMEHFNIRSTPTGTRVEFGKSLPPTSRRVDASKVKSISMQLAKSGSADPFDEIEQQNQELMKTLASLKEKQDQLADLNQELEDTNRGVVALYAELEQHSDDLRRVSDLKTSFLSNLSHEFRTPLNSISSLTRLLLEREDGDLSPEQEKQVTYIQHSAAELSELVNDLLDLAKVEAGKVDVKPKYFEVNDFFSGLRGMLKPLLSGNSLELIFDPTPNLPTLYADEGKLSQILRNLISNALKFTKRGYIKVTAELVDDCWMVFRVADTGIGIARADQERIFDEFVQVEGEMQAQAKGTGLGLPLSRRLAELMGGTLTVESEPFIGSTFTTMIPIRFGFAPAELPPQVLTQDAPGATVLFIEDNPETTFVHQSALKNSSYRAIFTANIPESRAAMKQIKPVLVVLDRLIDQKDCLFYIEELRSQGYAGPILVVSVVDDPKAAINAGAAAFLAKPVTPFTLLNTLRELIEGGPSKKILLVDDDEVSRYLVGGVLAKAGYRILEARGGREAIDMIRNEPPDAIILDMVMPDMNGVEVLREVRDNPASKQTPVIIHSSGDISNLQQKLPSDSETFLYSKQSLASAGGGRGLLQVLESAGIRL